MATKIVKGKIVKARHEEPAEIKVDKVVEAPVDGMVEVAPTVEEFNKFQGRKPMLLKGRK